ncbi:hypothetical protein NLM33_24230 [Bradyrhizobium sp. CCGUVB1N3]|nr:hypothetical protein [Bradyrhizobium sp. CCGUVB1N3]MCP3473424.1 hypothetical protein [Bradyrhizobium sp. CCGUVB1N3]
MIDQPSQVYFPSDTFAAFIKGEQAAGGQDQRP